MKYISIFLLIFLPVLLFANISELQNNLKNSVGKERMEILLELGDKTRYLDQTQSLDYGNEAIILSKTLDRVYQVEAFIVQSETFKRYSDRANAKKYAEEARKLAYELGKKEIMSESLINTINVCIVFNEFKTGFEHCLELLKHNNKKNNSFESDAYRLIGEIFYKLNNYKKALDYHKIALNICKKSGKKERIYNLKTALGLDFLLLKEYDKSLELFKQILKEISSDDSPEYAAVLNKIGRTYLWMKNYEQAMDFCDEALHYFSKTQDNKRKADIYNDIARIYYETGNFKKAVEFNLKAVEYRSKNKNISLVGSSYRNLGDIYRDIGEYNEAIAYYKKALGAVYGLNELELTQYVQEKMAKTYTALNKSGLALQSYEEYLNIYKLLYRENLQAEMLNEQFTASINSMEKENNILRKNNLNLEKEVDLKQKEQQYLILVLIFASAMLLSLLYNYLQNRGYSAKLQREVLLKTKKLNESQDVLQKIVDEKTVLLEEVRHRVRNNLQVVSSILRMMHSSNSDENIKQYIQQYSTRIFVLAQVHISVSKEDTHSVQLLGFIISIRDNLLSNFSSQSNKIDFKIALREDFININYAIPLGMICNELISNSIIHAFREGQECEISLKYYRKENENVLEYSDNGVGLPLNFDISTCKSYGLKMVYFQTKQLGGNYEIDSSKGFHFKFVFKDIQLNTFKKV